MKQGQSLHRANARQRPTGRGSTAGVFRTGKFQLGFAFILSASLALVGCIIGGTGTDTENGVNTQDKGKAPIDLTKNGVYAHVVDASGAPLSRVLVTLYRPDYRPDTGYGPVNVLIPGNKSPDTDTLGYARIPLADTGKFVAEGRTATGVLFYDTLKVATLGKPSVFTLQSRPSQAYHGAVALASGLHIDSGAVFIRGTPMWVRVDRDGNYDLGRLPIDVARMGLGIRFHAHPVTVKEVTAPSQNDPVILDTSHAGACHDLPTDSAARIASPPAGTPGANAAQTTPPTTADSLRVKQALAACDTLASGTVVNIRIVQDSVPTMQAAPAVKNISVIVTADSGGTSGTGGNAPTYVPYNQCVDTSTGEKLTFTVSVVPASGGSDLVFGDLSAQCLK